MRSHRLKVRIAGFQSVDGEFKSPWDYHMSTRMFPYIREDQCRGCGIPITRPPDWDPKQVFNCDICKGRIDCLSRDNKETPCYVMCKNCFLHYMFYGKTA